MNVTKTGELIRTLRRSRGLTQLALAEELNVSDKTISKWERGRGAPDIALLPAIAAALQVDVNTLLKGSLDPNDMSNGNLKKTKFYVCPLCGNVLLSTDEADITCCGHPLAPLQPKKADEAHAMQIVRDGREWYIRTDHPMTRDHSISFLALLTDDTVLLKKTYPEWDLDLHLPRFGHGLLVWHCTTHGLFYKVI